MTTPTAPDADLRERIETALYRPLPPAYREAAIQALLPLIAAERADAVREAAPTRRRPPQGAPPVSGVVACVALVLGYTLGRLRPARRASDWAARESYRHPIGARRAAVWLLLSAENIALLATHPVRGWHAWQHRNDPPPKRSPAPAYDPNWAANRHTTPEEPRP